MRRILAAIMRSILGVLAAPFQAVGWLFNRFLGGGGGSPEQVTQHAAAQAAADEVTQNQAARPERDIDRPSEIKRVAARLASGTPIGPNVKLSPGVVGALQVMPQADLRQLAASPPDLIAGFADAVRKMKFPEEPAPVKGRLAEKIAARKVAQESARDEPEPTGSSAGWATDY